MNFEAVIGLEIHVEMNTKSKMFSSAPVKFGVEPNTCVAPFDVAFPGTMPTVNKQAVINAIRACHALHMTIDHELWFDRKNYFYSDLPKGYQITQRNRPIGKEGYLDIETTLGKKRIHFERLHIEEDACKQIHYKDYTLLDFNRAGKPLIEIVSKPEINSAEEALKVVEKIRSIVTFLGVSTGKMEEGTLRCDVNVSLRPIGSSVLGFNVELKNINTLNNIHRAIEFEIKRQKALLLSGKAVKKETRRFDEIKKETVVMRDKNEDVDYKYFIEPNIPPIKLSSEFIEEAINSSPELAEYKYIKYLEMGLSEKVSNQIISSKAVSDYFDEAVAQGANPKLAANWILVEVQSVLNKLNIEIDSFKIPPSQLAELIKLIDERKINNKQARELFDSMLANSKGINELMKEIDINLISNEDELIAIIKQVLKDNPEAIIDFKNGKDKVIGFIVGQVMKLTKGKADPILTNKLVNQQLKEK